MSISKFPTCSLINRDSFPETLQQQRFSFIQNESNLAAKDLYLGKSISDVKTHTHKKRKVKITHFPRN